MYCMRKSFLTAVHSPRNVNGDRIEPVAVVPALKLHTREADLCEFKASLVYKEECRQAKAMQCDLFKQNKTTKHQEDQNVHTCIVPVVSSLSRNS